MSISTEIQIMAWVVGSFGVIAIVALIIAGRELFGFRPLKVLFDGTQRMDNPPLPHEQTEWVLHVKREREAMLHLEIAAQIMSVTASQPITSQDRREELAIDALKKAKVLINVWQARYAPEPPSNENTNFGGSRTYVKQDENSISTRP